MGLKEKKIIINAEMLRFGCSPQMSPARAGPVVLPRGPEPESLRIESTWGKELGIGFVPKRFPRPSPAPGGEHGPGPLWAHRALWS